MFDNVISGTSLTDSVSQEYFSGKIDCYNNDGICGSKDFSLLSTCRALMYPKMQEDETLWVSTWNIKGGTVPLDRAIHRAIEHGADTFVFNKRNVDFHIMIVDPNEVNVVHEFLDGTGYQWREIERIRVFYAKSFSCCVYVNDELRISLFFLGAPRSTRATFQCYHAAQCAIPVALPWFFDVESDKEKITPLDQKLMSAIQSGDFVTYQICIDEYVELFDYRQEMLVKKLEAFETLVARQRESSLMNRLGDIRNDIDCFMDKLSSLVREEKETQELLMAIKLGLEDKEGRLTLREFFEKNPNYRMLDHQNDSSILFAIDTYLDDWDEELGYKAINHYGSVLYDGINEAEADDAELLYRAIFIDRKIKIPMTGIFSMSADGRLYAIDGQSSSIRQEFMPNPHIYFYQCIEGYNPDIVQAMRREDRIFALEIARVSAGNINFGDNVVMERWNRWLFCSKCDNRRCFELPDGSRVGIDEAIQWLKNKGGGDE